MCVFSRDVPHDLGVLPPEAPVHGYKVLKWTGRNFRSWLMDSLWREGRLQMPQGTKPHATARFEVSPQGIYAWFSSKGDARRWRYMSNAVLVDVALHGKVIKFTRPFDARTTTGYMAQRAEIHTIWCHKSRLGEIKEATKDWGVEVKEWR